MTRFLLKIKLLLTTQSKSHGFVQKVSFIEHNTKIYVSQKKAFAWMSKTASWLWKVSSPISLDDIGFSEDYKAASTALSINITISGHPNPEAVTGRLLEKTNKLSWADMLFTDILLNQIFLYCFKDNLQVKHMGIY